SHDIVRQGIQILVNLVHRGAVGSDPLTGDGAGLLLQLPHPFFAAVSQRLGFTLPEVGRYGVGFIFLPKDSALRAQAQQIIEDKILGAGQKVLGWRDVPVNPEHCGPLARQTMPVMRQVFIGSTCDDEETFERELYIVRKWADDTARVQLPTDSCFYVASYS